MLHVQAWDPDVEAIKVPLQVVLKIVPENDSALPSMVTLTEKCSSRIHTDVVAWIATAASYSDLWFFRAEGKSIGLVQHSQSRCFNNSFNGVSPCVRTPRTTSTIQRCHRPWHLISCE